MRTLERGSAVGSAKNGETRSAYRANPDEGSEASHIILGILPPPPPLPNRWVPHRKAEIVAAVRGGYLTLDEACQRYALSVEEFLAWQRGLDLFGLAGLRVNGTQQRQRIRARCTDS